MIQSGARAPRWTFPEDDGAWDLLGRATLLEHVLDGLAEGVIVTDAAGHIVVSSRTALHLLGPIPPRADLSAWFDAAGLEPADGADSGTAGSSLLARALGGAEVTEEAWLLCARADREPRHLAVVAHPLRGDHDAVDGAVVVLRDVTARVHATEGLERLSRAVDQTADMVVITNRDGVILYVNQAFTQMTGYTRDDALGRTPSILKSGEHPPTEFARLWQTILSGDVYRGTLVNRRKDGTCYAAEQTITPMKDAAGRVRHFVAVSKDMTERIRLRAREVESQLAAAVQRRLYPAACPATPGLDVAGAVCSAEATCGDYYDLLLRPDGRLAVVVGDVSGHGMPAAIVMAETRAYLRSLITTPLPADEILRRINGLLREDLAEGDYVSLLLVEIEPSSRRIRYANAGHLPGYRIRGGRATGDALPPTGPALGIRDAATYGLEDAAPLEDGEVLLLLTDGAVEAPGPTGEPLDDPAVMREAGRLVHLPAARLVAELHDVIRRLSAGLSSRDDVTLVAVKACGASRTEWATPEPPADR